MGWLRDVERKVRRARKKLKWLPIVAVSDASIELAKNANPAALVANKIDPRVANLRWNAGLAGATAVVGGYALGAAGGAGAGATAAGSQFAVPVPSIPAGGSNLSWLDSVTQTIGGVADAAAKAKSTLDQFGSPRASSPDASYAIAEPPPQGMTIPTPWIVGGAVAIVALVLLVRK